MGNLAVREVTLEDLTSAQLVLTIHPAQRHK